MLLQSGLDGAKLLGPFSDILDGVVTDKFVRNWMNLLCFLLSGEAMTFLFRSVFSFVVLVYLVFISGKCSEMCIA